MLRKTRPALSVFAMVLATAGNIASADKKLYPATFCEPNHGGAIACLDYSRHGFVVNRCQQAIDVVCPLVRDKVGSEERFIEITVSYDTEEAIACSFRGNSVSIQDILENPLYTEKKCDFVMPANDHGMTVRRNSPYRQECASNQMPQTFQYATGYTLTCRLPHDAKIGHYFADEPDH